MSSLDATLVSLTLPPVVDVEKGLVKVDKSKKHGVKPIKIGLFHGVTDSGNGGDVQVISDYKHVVLSVAGCVEYDGVFYELTNGQYISSSNKVLRSVAVSNSRLKVEKNDSFDDVYNYVPGDDLLSSRLRYSEHLKVSFFQYILTYGVSDAFRKYATYRRSCSGKGTLISDYIVHDLEQRGVNTHKYDIANLNSAVVSFSRRNSSYPSWLVTNSAIHVFTEGAERQKSLTMHSTLGRTWDISVRLLLQIIIIFPFMLLYNACNSIFKFSQRLGYRTIPHYGVLIDILRNWYALAATGDSSGKQQLDPVNIDRQPHGVYTYPIFSLLDEEGVRIEGRIIPSESCTVVKNFKMSTRFKIEAQIGLKITNTGFETLGENKRKRHYRTVLGNHVLNSGVVYDYSTNGLLKALSYRLAGQRDDEELLSDLMDADGNYFLKCVSRHEDEAYMKDLKTISKDIMKLPFKDNPMEVTNGIDLYIEYLKECALSITEEDSKIMTESRVMSVQNYVNRPNPSRVFRQRTFKEMMESPTLFEGLDLAPISGKFKMFEVAKPGKAGRMFIDLGSNRTCYHPLIPEVAKHCMEFKFEKDFYSVWYFSSPRPPDLTELFREIENSGLTKWFGMTLYFVYFSDDSILVYKDEKGTQRFNLDISSNDVTNSSATFMYLYYLCSKMGADRNDTLELINQANSTIRIRDKEESFLLKIKPTRPCEMSGSVLTTLVNNCATSRTAFSIISAVQRNNKINENIIIAACRAVGYTVTCEVCECMEDLQFLKHSPHMSNKGIVAMMNLGVVFKKFGTVQGDLTSVQCKGLSPKTQVGVEAYYASITGGLCKGVTNPFNTVLIDKFAPDTSRATHMLYILKDGDWNMAEYIVDNDSLAKRYGVDVGEMLAALELYKKCGHNEVVKHDFFTTVLKKDYGIGEMEQVTSQELTLV